MIHPGRSGDAATRSWTPRSSQLTKTCSRPSATVLTLTQGWPGYSRTWVDHRRPARRPGPDTGVSGERPEIPDAAISRNTSPAFTPPGADAAAPLRVAVLIGEVNASDQAVEDQFLRARQAAGIAARLEHAAEQAAARARTAEDAHLAIQAGTRTGARPCRGR